MADLALAARSPLAGAARPARPDGDPGVLIGERTTGRVFTVLARKDQANALVERAKGFGVSLPPTPRRVTGRGHTAVWTGPGQWMVEVEGEDAGPLLRSFATAAALCSTVATDDARILLTVGGARARDTLAKMLTLDLHPRAFKPGDVAVTVAGGISVLVWLREDEPVFECAVPRSTALAFYDWLVTSATEYGCAAA